MIDTGVDTSHVDLAANIWTNPGEIPGNSIDDDGNGYVDDVHGWDFVEGDTVPQDDDSHGTHQAGIIGAVGNNGGGVTGVNWTTSIMPLRVIGPSSTNTSDVISAIDYAVANGADIINLSFESPDFSQGLSDAIDAAYSAGCLIVSSAGNDTADNDTTPQYPASYASDGIISVAATDRNDVLATFSNYGATSVDIAAPGVSILGTTPGDTYSFYSGTSQAAAEVSGAAALLLSQHPDWTPDQIKAQLLGTADAQDSLAGKVVSGGRLDVGRAVSESIATPPAVTGLLPGAAIRGPIQVIRVAFGEALDPATFDAGDVTVTDPDSNPVTVQRVRPVAASGDQTFDIVLSAAQSAVGTYAVTIGPAIDDASGTPMSGAYNGSVTIRDSTPPTFVSGTPAGTTNGPVTTLQLTFSEPIDPTSLTAGDLVVLGPAGIVNVTAIDPTIGMNDAVFDVAIDAQSADGDYLVTIGRFVNDVAGNPMTSAGSFGFTLGTPTPPTVLAITPGSAIRGPVRVTRVTFAESIDPATFTTDDVAYTGPNGAVTVDRIRAVTGSDGTQFDVITAAQSTPGEYSVVVGPAVTDLAGNPMAGSYQGAYSIIDTSAPVVTAYTPDVPINGPVRVVRVTFDKALATYWLRPEAISMTGPSGSITVTRVRPVAGKPEQMDIVFPDQTESGDYTVTIDTTIRNIYGVRMTDPYQLTFTIR